MWYDGDVGYSSSVTPTIWYCTDPNFDTTNADSINLATDPSWTTTAPTNNAIVYGVAIDYSHDADGHIMSYEDELLIAMTIYMKNMCMESKTFNSNARLVADADNGEASVTLTMQVSVEFPTLAITLSSNPTSGTEDNPRDVFYEQDVIYDVTVSNRGARAVENVVVTLDIPEGTYCDINSLFIGGVPITASPLISNARIEGNKVFFTIKTVRAGTSVTITQNTYVNTLINGILVMNTGKIESYNDMTLTEDLKFTSNTTYHITLTIPDPTGFSDKVVPYLCILGMAMATLIVVKRKKKGTT